MAGASSVVTKDVEPYEIIAGDPAEHIGWRFSEEVREQLLEIKWRKWDRQRMKRNSEFFDTNLEKHEGDLKDIIVD